MAAEVDKSAGGDSAHLGLLIDEVASLRVQLEMLRRESQADLARAHLAAIVESSDDAVISKSLDGVVLSWNSAAERIFGYGSDEMIGRSILTIIPEDRQDEEREIIARLQAGERINHFNTVRVTRDGHRIDVLVSISPIRDASGQIVGASKILRDMTDRRLVEQALLDGQARLQAVVDNAVDGILTISELGIIESINAAGVRTFGYAPEELIGKNVKNLMPEPYFGGHDTYLSNYRQTGQRKIIGIGREVLGKRRDDSTFPVDLAVSEVQLGDRRIFTGIVRDITSRKESERALVEEKEKAEAASRAKEHFLSILSHELRTPLTPALAELSFMEARADLSSEIRSHLEMIRRNVETEARLVDDLLDLTRLARTKIQLHYEAVDLHDSILGVARMFDQPIKAKALETRLALRAKRHHVWADPGRLQQILLNLLSNAIKFTTENGWISIASSNPSENSIEVKISDNGQGIDAEFLGRIFDAFEQSEQSRRTGGLGLGLSIAKSLTEMHKGTLTASSDGIGLGSSFLLELTTVLHLPQADVPVEPAVGKKLQQRILLVEDHEDTRSVMTRLLKSLGCRVTTAGSVREAIKAAERGTFDLLISDIGLPDGSGLDVMKHFKQMQIKGIALSGFGQEEDVLRSREAGFEMHLTKPLNFNRLKDVLQRLN